MEEEEEEEEGVNRKPGPPSFSLLPRTRCNWESGGEGEGDDVKECHLAHCKKRNCTAKRKEIVLVQKKNCEKKPREEEGPFSVLISRLTAHSRQTDRRPATNR